MRLLIDGVAVVLFRPYIGLPMIADDRDSDVERLGQRKNSDAAQD